MKQTQWVVVLNNVEARFFELSPNKKLSLFHRLEHPEGRLKNHDLVSDKPGRDFESTYSGTRHMLEPHTTPKDQEQIEFGRKVATYLGTALKKGEFSRLYLAANPVLLGVLRKLFSHELSKAVTEEVTKDLTRTKDDELAAYFNFSFI